MRSKMLKFSNCWKWKYHDKDRIRVKQEHQAKKLLRRQQQKHQIPSIKEPEILSIWYICINVVKSSLQINKSKLLMITPAET